MLTHGGQHFDDPASRRASRQPEGCGFSGFSTHALAKASL
jgi:hypothetical protein